LLGVAGVILGTRYVLKNAVEEYTDTQPMTIPKVEVAPSEVTNLQQRLQTFQAALKAGTAQEPLVLNERELNALLTSSPDTLPLKNHVYVSIQGDQLKGQVSLPLSKFINWSMMQGRYLNGAASIKASLENGVLVVTIQSLQVKGKEVPESVMAQLRAQNLAQDLYKDPEAAEFMRTLDSLQVKDGRITVKGRASK